MKVIVKQLVLDINFLAKVKCSLKLNLYFLNFELSYQNQSPKVK